MARQLVLLFFIVGVLPVWSQVQYGITGEVRDHLTKEVVAGVQLRLGDRGVVPDPATGQFLIMAVPSPNYILTISAPSYRSLRLPLVLEDHDLDLGTLFLERDLVYENSDNLILLTDADLLEDEMSPITAGMLQASKDVFLNKAAFDFGQAFFRIRGYGSEYGEVLLNGTPMNRFISGRPEWNNWGGLNDVTRNQEFTHGLQASDHNFGGILGATYIDTRPTGLRKGLRLSTSYSNKTYTGRLMATYSSGAAVGGLSYTVSASRRWAPEGYIRGTLYDSYSFFGAVEYALNKNHSFMATALMAATRRGRSAAITEEVFTLLGRQYNPYWGYQEGDLRNTRERRYLEPILMFDHYYGSDRLDIHTGAALQFGTTANRRLGYYNAPNPDPTYYRYLPSFYINSPIGANFVSANMARQGLLLNPQLNWDRLYQANKSADAQGRAAYVLYDDMAEETQFTLHTVADYRVTPALKLQVGATYRNSDADYYAEISDLLGASYHEDVDPFSTTRNNMMGSVEKRVGDTFNYSYRVASDFLQGFVQIQLVRPKWEAFVAGNYAQTSFQREGLFQNERFADNSLGMGSKVAFSDYGTKGGFTYKINGRHWINANGALLTKPPVHQNVFINPRENHQIVPHIQSEKINTVDLNYYLRLPKVTGRITGFYTRFQNTTDVNFFFVDAGVGSDFVQEVLTDLDKLHMGTELGLEYQVSPAVKLLGVAAVGKFLYASDPSVAINFDTAGAEEDLINLEGSIDLGPAAVKGYRLAQGPQKAFALGVEYRDPKYWWVGATTNFLSANYANISTITRTASFYLDPNTGKAFPDATPENVRELLAQDPLGDIYLLNLTGGKSWLTGKKYLSVFASINNVFDAVYKTGGYEQSRNGHFGQLRQDNLSGNPSFAPKYWYGYGRTFFLNFAISF